MTRNTVIVIAGVAIAVVLAVVVALGGGTSDPAVDDTESAFAPVEVVGEGLPEFARGSTDPAVGMEAPTLNGTDIEGSPYVVEPGGEPMVVIFLAHWCPHCQAEVPRLQEWLDETGGEEGVELVGIATGTDPSRPNFPPQAWLEREGFTPPVLLDDRDNTARVAYGMSSYPSWVVVDGQGRVALRLVGELERDGIEELFRQVAGLTG